MLDAVVVGDVFASPTVSGVLAAIRATDTGRGVLFVLGNYAGDIMNFEMAAESARDEGHEVEIVIVRDDVAPGSDPEKRRGLAGELFTWKACGAMAARGETLAEVRRIAERVNIEASKIIASLRPGSPQSRPVSSISMACSQTLARSFGWMSIDPSDDPDGAASS